MVIIYTQREEKEKEKRRRVKKMELATEERKEEKGEKSVSSCHSGGLTTFKYEK